MAKWQVLSSKEVYSTPWIKVREDKVLNHNSKPLTYGLVELQNPSVFIVATNTQGHIALIRNYRYTVDRDMWEVPAGFVDKKEDRVTAAKRELVEETGLTSDDWTELGTLYQANGIGVIPFTAFLAQNAQSSGTTRDPDEDITALKFIEFEQIEQMIKKGDIIESAHIAAFYLAKLHGIKKGGS